MLHAFNASTARTQVAHDRPGVIFRRHHFHRHYRLKNYRARLARSLFERHRTGDLECHFVRVHIVVTAVVKCGLHVDHRIARKDATFHGFLHALVDGLDIFLRHRAAHDVVDELVAFARLVWIEINLGVPVLPAPAGLPDVLAFRLGVLANGLAIRDLWLADVRFHFIFTHHAVD